MKLSCTSQGRISKSQDILSSAGFTLTDRHIEWKLTVDPHANKHANKLASISVCKSVADSR